MIAALSDKKIEGRIEFGIIYGGIALLALFAGQVLPLLTLAPSCAFKAFTGLPCPTCGSTRAIVHLSNADFSSAFAMNPLFATLIVAAILWLFYSFVTLVFNLRRLRFFLTKAEKDRARFFAVFIPTLNWIYLLLSA